MNPGIYGLTSQEGIGPYPLLGRPTPVPTIDPIVATHPDAQDWHARVIANGGSVSRQTLQAVDQFCGTVDSIGIRDRFYRLNLFAGSGIAAALVPLYCSRTAGGTVLGNRVDTNNGPFVSSDYTERGSTGGLTKSDGASTKFLNTGLATNAFPQFITAHAAASFSSSQSVTNGFVLGKGESANYNNQGTDRYFWFIGSASVACALCSATSTGELTINQSPFARYIFSRTAANLITGYRNGVAAGSNTSTVSAPTTSTATFRPFIESNSCFARMHYYSIGDSLTAAQAAALDSAFSAYLTALGRS